MKSFSFSRKKDAMTIFRHFRDTFSSHLPPNSHRNARHCSISSRKSPLLGGHKYRFDSSQITGSHPSSFRHDLTPASSCRSKERTPSSSLHGIFLSYLVYRLESNHSILNCCHQTFLLYLLYSSSRFVKRDCLIIRCYRRCLYICQIEHIKENVLASVAQNSV